MEENLQSHEAALASKTSELELKETELVETKDYLAQLQDELESERKDFQLKLEDAIKVGISNSLMVPRLACLLRVGTSDAASAPTKIPIRLPYQSR